MKKVLWFLLLFPLFVKGQTIHIVTSSDTVCMGAPAHFHATASGTSVPHYKWKVNSTNVGTDSSGFTTHTLNNGDTVLCLLTNSIGDTIFARSDSIIMTVQTLLTVSPIIGDDSMVCEGATIVLSDTTPNGRWVANNSNAIVTDGKVKGVDGGHEGFKSTDSIYYIVQNSCGSDTAFKVIIIEPIPNAGFSFSRHNLYDWDFCVGDNGLINLGEGMEGGLFIKKGNDLIYVPNSGSVYFGQKGNFTYMSISTNFCGSDTASWPITVYDKPNPGTIITTSFGLCLGDSIVLIDSSSYGNSSWSASNKNASIAKGPDNFTEIVKGIKSGYDVITLNVSNLCGEASTAIAISIGTPRDIIGPDSLCLNDSFFLRNTTNGGIWNTSNSNTIFIDSTSGLITGVSNGIAVITYSLRHECYTTKTITVTNCNVNAEIFPNPSRNELVIHVNKGRYNFFSLMNSTGQVVIKEPISGPYTNVNTQFLAPGLYIVYLTGDSDKYITKFVKE